MAPVLTTTAPATPDAGNANDAMVDLLYERAIDLIRLEAGTRDKVIVLLDELEREIVAAVAAIDPTGPARARYQRDRLVRLQTEVESSIKATYRTSDTLLAREIRDVVDNEATWTASAINSSIQAIFADAGLTRTLLDTLVSDVLIQGAPTKDWWERQAAGLSNAFMDQMRQGIAIGDPLSKLIDRVRGNATQRGVMDLARNSAERLVRSSVQTAANVARESTYAQNSDLIKALQWSATLDTRTSIWCITRDGHQYGVINHESLDDGPPWLQGAGRLHWNCRSTSIPILKSWRDIGIDADDVPDTTRASMDGQVAAQTTFESWLKKQSAARQDTVLGNGKASLWRQGKITFRDLLDQNGRPLTTEQLRAKYAARQA